MNGRAKQQFALWDDAFQDTDGVDHWSDGDPGNRPFGWVVVSAVGVGGGLEVVAANQKVWLAGVLSLVTIIAVFSRVIGNVFRMDADQMAARVPILAGLPATARPHAEHLLGAGAGQVRADDERRCDEMLAQGDGLVVVDGLAPRMAGDSSPSPA
ncbi:hypothetical protein OG883_42940 [Streptomyces sp. NBC_01142]|uniref:hypothetical protein n=1 Tax=Streptomyces sp. NBC_01142 TaxID=2975865 RepID=UPI0022580278|nr:hypothetical protein [Streptomyces sp. NBC_01142]MCX4826401.1 hypothetical protein [Streptomyces sp. NBC_01142]